MKFIFNNPKNSYKIGKDSEIEFLYNLNKSFSFILPNEIWGNYLNIGEIINVAIREFDFNQENIIVFEPNTQYRIENSYIAKDYQYWFSHLGSFILHKKNKLNNEALLKEKCPYILQITNIGEYKLFEMLIPSHIMVSVYLKYMESNPSINKELRLDLIPEAQALEEEFKKQISTKTSYLNH